MGLDNMPYKYPCDTANTAVRLPYTHKETGEPLLNEDGSVMTRIDCGATQAAGGCPYTKCRDEDDMGEGSVVGMFGTDCWYRGKYGNYLLERLDMNEDEYSFYGDNEDATYKSPAACMELAEAMEESFYEHGQVVDEEGNSLNTDIRYAIWYLQWIAKYGLGMSAWY